MTHIIPSDALGTDYKVNKLYMCNLLYYLTILRDWLISLVSSNFTSLTSYSCYCVKITSMIIVNRY